MSLARGRPKGNILDLPKTDLCQEAYNTEVGTQVPELLTEQNCPGRAALMFILEGPSHLVSTTDRKRN